MDGKLLRKHQGKGEKVGFMLNQPDRILAEGKPEWSDIIWEMIEDKEHDQIVSVIRYWGWEVLVYLA